MIQRIQSIYLLLASLSGGALFALPFATGNKMQEGILTDGLFNIQDHLVLLILTSMVAAIALLSIFLFNNRKLQMNIGKVNLLLTLGLIGWTAYLFLPIIELATLGLGFPFPFVLIIMTLLANKNILKDERLVRSADRIR